MADCVSCALDCCDTCAAEMFDLTNDLSCCCGGVTYREAGDDVEEAP